MKRDVRTGHNIRCFFMLINTSVENFVVLLNVTPIYNHDNARCNQRGIGTALALDDAMRRINHSDEEEDAVSTGRCNTLESA